MAWKKISGLTCLALALFAVGVSFWWKEEAQVEESKPVQNVKKASVAQKPVVKQEETKPKYDLYSSTPYDLPLISVVDISKLSPEIKKIVDEILEESQGFYYLEYDKDSEKVFIILQNPIVSDNTYIRHGLQLVEISQDGSKSFTNLGYVGEEDEIDNAVEDSKTDIWEFDRTVEPARPIKHIKYSDKGKIEFTEIWDYSTDEAVKYQMKNSRKKVVSILKETSGNESNYRREHIFYDEGGNTQKSITINYDGANISRFTYYDAQDDSYNISIMSEYSEGMKVKEFLYNDSYELLNTVQAEYSDGERSEIKVFDSENKEVEILH